MSWIKNKILALFVKTKGKISKPLFGGLGHVYMLHRVLPSKENNHSPFNNGLAIDPQKLSKTIEYFKQENYDFLSLGEMVDRIEGKKSPKPFIVFTLDDGYLDNFTNALPIFEKYNVPFCIYITTCFPNNTATFWWYILEEHVAKNNSLDFSIEDKSYNFEWKNKAELKKVYPEIKRVIKEISPTEFKGFIKKTFNISDVDLRERASKLAMNWEQIKKLTNHPLVTIGSHTLNHLSLKNMSSEQVKTEVESAKIELEEKLNIKIEHFAYPYGGHNDVSAETSEIVNNIAGIKTAVLNLPGNLFHELEKNQTLIPRYPLGNNTTEEKLKFQINGIAHFSNNGWKKIVKLN